MRGKPVRTGTGRQHARHHMRSGRQLHRPAVGQVVPATTNNVPGGAGWRAASSAFSPQEEERQVKRSRPEPPRGAMTLRRANSSRTDTAVARRAQQHVSTSRDARAS